MLCYFHCSLFRSFVEDLLPDSSFVGIGLTVGSFLRAFPSCPFATPARHHLLAWAKKKITFLGIVVWRQQALPFLATKPRDDASMQECLRLYVSGYMITLITTFLFCHILKFFISTTDRSTRLDISFVVIGGVAVETDLYGKIRSRIYIGVYTEEDGKVYGPYYN